MHYLTNNMNYLEAFLHKTPTTFLHRHAEGSLNKDGTPTLVEDFYINQPPPDVSCGSTLYCFAYGDCSWQNYQMGDYISRPLWSFEYLCEGSAVFTCDKIRYNIRPGDVYILRTGKRISVRTEPGGKLKKKCILIEKHFLEYIYETGPLNGIDVIHAGDSTRLPAIYENIRNLVTSPEDQFQSENLSVQLYALLIELEKLALPNQYPDILLKAIKMINGEISANHTLESLSHACNTSVNTLSRLFRKYMSCSPVKYIIDRRLEQAKRLIYMDKMTLKEVAERCGYNSESFLSRSFRKKFGMSPIAFKHSK